MAHLQQGAWDRGSARRELITLGSIPVLTCGDRMPLIPAACARVCAPTARRTHAQDHVAGLAILPALAAPRRRRTGPPGRSRSSCRSPPGGGIDVSARIQALRMSEFLGQPIVVENIGAAAGTIGAPARRQGRARRLHVPDRQFRHARLQPVPLQEAALQFRRPTSSRSAWFRNRRASCSRARTCR